MKNTRRHKNLQNAGNFRTSPKKLGVFEKSPALSCRASARHPFQEIPRFTRYDRPPACYFVRDSVSWGDPSLSRLCRNQL